MVERIMFVAGLEDEFYIRGKVLLIRKELPTKRILEIIMGSLD